MNNQHKLTTAVALPHTESYYSLMRYFIPEFITSLLLFSMPFWLDAYFIGHLKSTPTYATLGATNTLLHLLVKIAEAFGVGTLVLTGYWNGQNNFKAAGKVIRDSLWLTTLLGIIGAIGLYCGAQHIYTWYGVPQEMIVLGIPFLRVRAFGMLFTFLCLACLGFLRGIKNTRTPMYIFIVGTLVFIFFDYALIFGAFGLPCLGLLGSALACVIQYGVMTIVALAIIVMNRAYKKYEVTPRNLLTNFSYFRSLFALSWPIIIDKATIALCYIWLCKMLAHMGTCAVATFCVVKDMERFVFLPAIACAQIITFLVSNDYGRKQWVRIIEHIKKIIIMSCAMVAFLIAIMCLWSQHVITFFDKKGEFTCLAKGVFPILSILIFFDVLQLIFAAALRGAEQVKIVMIVRVAVACLFFLPVSYAIAHLSIANSTMHFIMIYASFYISNAIMSSIYLAYLKTDYWKQPCIRTNHE